MAQAVTQTKTERLDQPVEPEFAERAACTHMWIVLQNGCFPGIGSRARATSAAPIQLPTSQLPQATPLVAEKKAHAAKPAAKKKPEP